MITDLIKLSIDTGKIKIQHRRYVYQIHQFEKYERIIVLRYYKSRLSIQLVERAYHNE